MGRVCSREWVWEGWDSRVERSYVSQEFRHQVSVLFLRVTTFLQTVKLASL